MAAAVFGSGNASWQAYPTMMPSTMATRMREAKFFDMTGSASWRPSWLRPERRRVGRHQLARFGGPGQGATWSTRRRRTNPAPTDRRALRKKKKNNREFQAVFYVFRANLSFNFNMLCANSLFCTEQGITGNLSAGMGPFPATIA